MTDAAIAELAAGDRRARRLRCRRRRAGQLLPPSPAKPATAAAGAAPAPRPAAAPRVERAERAAILDELHSERFVDMSPTEVWATLLDEGRYLGSISTFYRLLRQAGESRERRRQATHPATVKPELVANEPNSVWSWDITKLRGPAKWTWYYLYVILDIFSRYVVGWMVASRESAALAEVLIRQTCAKQGIGRDQLTIHADRGSSMTSKPVAFLLADLGVTQSHSRPHVSDDNPFSEAQFKTLKYRPDFPDWFDSIEAARRALPDLLRLVQQRTSPYRAGLAHSRRRALRHRRHHPRQARRRARRRLRRPPGTVRAKAARPPNLPTGSWINKPDDTEEAAQ